jgi:hypothetical protein
VFFGELGYEIAGQMDTGIGINAIAVHLLGLVALKNANSWKGEISNAGKTSMPSSIMALKSCPAMSKAL